METYLRSCPSERRILSIGGSDILPPIVIVSLQEMCQISTFCYKSKSVLYGRVYSCLVCPTMKHSMCLFNIFALLNSDILAS
jgi:hypothetical protein